MIRILIQVIFVQVFLGGWIQLVFCGSKLYIPSIYDVRTDPSDKIYQKYHGYYKTHYFNKDKDQFGDISLMTLNSHVERDTLERNQVEDIRNLVDKHHPSILAIQGLSEDVLKELSSSDHYEATCRNAINLDIRMNKKEYLPIFYDKHALLKMYEKVFYPRNYKNQSYGCAVVFLSKITGQIFTAVNIDLFSADSKMIDVQFYTIVLAIKKSKFANQPIFVLGTINSMSDKLRKLVESGYKNLNMLDRNNDSLDKTTFHSHGIFKDNIQRDFILLNDEQKKFVLNYSRTLSRMPKNNFEHYPVYSILSKNEPINKKI